jgi:hypothetical protein
MHPQARRVCRRHDRRQWIERRRLTLQLGRARLEAAVVVRVGASAHLDEQRVEAVSARIRYQRADRFGG